MGSRMDKKSVIVTGGSKGLGRGIAKVFAREGAKVLVVARQPDAGELTTREIVDAGGAASFFRADVSNRDDVEAMVEAAAGRHGGIDILCSNAGIFPSVRLEEMTDEDWDTVNAVNLKGTFLVVKACLPELKKAGEGRILLTSSITGPITGYPGWAQSDYRYVELSRHLILLLFGLHRIDQPLELPIVDAGGLYRRAARRPEVGCHR